MTVQRCCHCNRVLLLNSDNFKETKTGFTKTCLECKAKRDNRQPSWTQMTCEHNKERRYCVDCGGSQICEHNRIRSTCKDCGGSQICEHNKQRRYCIDCSGSDICTHGKIKNRCKACSDPIEITLKSFVVNWKKRDKKNNVYDEANFIDFDYLKTLLEQQNSCCSQCSSLLTFENKSTARLFLVNNDLGHVKGNCVFKCQSCIQSCKKRKRE